VPYADAWAGHGLPIYLPPLVFVKHPEKTAESGIYTRIDKPPLDSGGGAFPAVRVGVTPHELAVLLEVSPNHIMADGVYTGECTGAEESKYDYRTMILTATIETDDRLRVEWELPKRTDDGPEIELTLYLPDAEVWYVAKGTVKGLKDDGTLDIEDAAKTLRDDSELLVSAAALAKAWYGVARASIECALHGIQLSPTVGQMIKACFVRDVLALESNSMVTQVTYDFPTPQTPLGATRISTAHGELDIAAMVL
jgi:hypothetical protein